MWVAKIKIDSKGTLIGTKAKKYHVNVFAFPLSYYYGKKWIVLHIAGNLIGKDNDKKSFIKELEKEKKVVNFEVKDDFFIGMIKDPIFLKILYSKDIIHVEAPFISEEGYEVMCVGCFEKQPLIKIVKILEKKYSGELISIEQKKIKSISVIKISSDLTDKQKQAMHLAIKNGYYNYPRKIDLPKLAKLMGISYSTFQAHLRKAEQKLIPYSFGNY